MTTEDDFHRALDANPNDHQTRLVFADWLQEHDDPRAAGYRALGTLRKNANHWKPPPDDQIRVYPEEWGWGNTDNDHYRDQTHMQHYMLPPDWLSHVVSSHPGYNNSDTEYWSHHQTQREANDAAALGFASLPPERQQEIVTPKPSPEQLTRRRLARQRYGKM